MAKKKHAVIAYFPGADKADSAANQLKSWDKANNDVQLGGIGIYTREGGKLITRKVGGRATGSGVIWGAILGANTGCLIGIVSAFVTLVGGTLIGTVGGVIVGAVAGALFHKSLGLTVTDKERIVEHLKEGGAALVVSADEGGVFAIRRELTILGGKVKDYMTP